MKKPRLITGAIILFEKVDSVAFGWLVLIGRLLSIGRLPLFGALSSFLVALINLLMEVSFGWLSLFKPALN